MYVWFENIFYVVCEVVLVYWLEFRVIFVGWVIVFVEKVFLVLNSFMSWLVVREVVLYCVEMLVWFNIMV